MDKKILKDERHPFKILLPEVFENNKLQAQIPFNTILPRMPELVAFLDELREEDNNVSNIDVIKLLGKYAEFVIQAGQKEIENNQTVTFIIKTN